MNVKGSNAVDTRFLKSGHIRLRFKLSKPAYRLVNQAMGLTGFRYLNSSLDAISLNYLAGYPSSLTLDFPAIGKERFLTRLHKDEYETVRGALDIARTHVNSDTEALVLMCLQLIAEEKSNKIFGT